MKNAQVEVLLHQFLRLAALLLLILVYRTPASATEDDYLDDTLVIEP